MMKKFLKLFLLLFVVLLNSDIVKAYYGKNIQKTIPFTTKEFTVSASINGTSFTGDATQIVTVPVSVTNSNSYGVSYSFTLSNSNLKFSGGSTTYTGTIAANTTSTINLPIVEVSSNGTDTTNITMQTTVPYSQTTVIGNYSLIYDNQGPTCSLAAGSSNIALSGTTTLTLTCTDAITGVSTTSLASSALTASKGTITYNSATAITGGYKYTFTYRAGTTGGIDTISLPAGKVSDAVGNKNALTTLNINVNLTATIYYYNGNNVKATCTPASGSTSCNITIPTTVSNSTGASSGTYVGVASSSTSKSVLSSYSISSDVTWYAVYKNNQTVTFTYSACTGANCNNFNTTSSTKSRYEYKNYQGTQVGCDSVTPPSANVGIYNTIGTNWGTSAITSCYSSYTQTYSKSVTYNYYNGGTSTVHMDSTISTNGKYSWTWRETLSSYGTVPSGKSWAGVSPIPNGTDFNPSSNTIYAVYEENITVTFKYYNNQTATSSGIKYYNYQNTLFKTGAAPIPSAVVNSTGVNSAIFTGLSTSSSSSIGVSLIDNGDGTGYSVSVGNTTYYAYYSKGITATFYYYNNQTATANATRYTSYNGSLISNSNYTIPTAVINSSAPNTSYRGVTTDSLSTTLVTPTTANTTYYASYSGTVTISYLKGSNVSAIGKTSDSGTQYCNHINCTGVTFNLPSITANTGYTSVGWGTSSGATSGLAVGSDLTLSSNATRYANATDQTKPTCTITSAVTINENGTGTIVLSCTDTSGSISPSSLTSEDFTIGNPTKVSIQSITAASIAAGKKFTITVAGLAKGTSTIGLRANTIKDAAGNSANSVSSTVSVARTLTLSVKYADETVAYTRTCNLIDNDSCTISNLTAPTNPYSSNWTYSGWGTNSIVSGTTATLTSSASIYAYYTKSVVINFNSNNCTTTDASTTVNFTNGNNTKAVQVPSRTMNSGWTSLGASSSASSTSSGTAMLSNMNITVSDNQFTYTAYYNCKRTATITFDANGCTTASKTATLNLYNGSLSGSVIVPTATMNSGWTSLGASVSSSSTSSGTAMGSSMTLSNVTGTEATRYYNCKKDAKTYTVSYNANISSAPSGITATAPSSQNCTIPAVYNGASQGTTCTITTPSFSYETGNWDFAGWGTSASSTSGLAGTITVSSSHTRYAVWAKTITVAFNANGCTTSGGSASKTIYNFNSSAISVTVPTKTMNSGWTSLGASSSSSSTSSGTAMGSSMSISPPMGPGEDSVTRYYNCKKDAKTYTATYSCNGGSGSVSSTSCTIAAAYNGASQPTSCSITAPSSGCTYSGWGFEGWNANSAATFGFTGTVDISQNHSYYAIWKKDAISRTATFSCNGGSGSVTNKKCTIAAVYNGASQPTSCSITLPTSGCSYSGWTFEGWNVSSSGTIGVTGEVNLSNDRAYNAIWSKQVTRTVTYYGNGNTGGSTASTSCQATVYNGGTTGNCNLTLASNGFTKTGWTFNGWGTGTGSTSGLSAGASITIGSDKSYYATWKKNVTVTFNANGCTSGSGSASCTLYNGNTSCSVTTPSHTTNSGWTDTTPSSSTLTVSSTATTASTNFTCSKVLTLTCIKGSNVSSIGATSKTCTVYNGSTSGCSVALPSITANTGYTSVGWSTTNGATSGTAAGTNITITANATRYANATDQTKPTCGTATGDSTSWRKSSQTISVGCSDSGSGCSQTSFSKSFSNTKQGTITISDNAGNTRDCTVNAYVDTTVPSLTCTITSNNSTSGVKVKRVFSDALSGLSSGEGPGVSKTLEDTYTSSQTFTAKDNANNTKSCKLTVSSTISKYDRKYYTCSTPTFSSWSLSSTTYSASCTPSTNTSTCATCTSYSTCTGQYSTTTCTNNGVTTPNTSSPYCYARRTYTRSRNGCSAYTYSSTTSVTSCTESSNNYGKYTCTATEHTYSGSIG